MRRWCRAVAVLAAALSCAPTEPVLAAADGGSASLSDQLRVGGSLRLRGETKEGFDFSGSGSQDYLLTQLRVNLRWDPEDWISVFAEGQDARVLGESRSATPAINQDAVPNVFADRFDLHQGYADIRYRLSGKPLTVRLGRQKSNLGAQRLIASLEWENTARVWDGVRVTVGRPQHQTLELIASRLVPVDPEHFNDYDTTPSRLFNSRFFAGYYTDSTSIPSVQFEGYLLLRSEGRIDDQVFTLGTRWQTEKEPWEADLEAAFQLGEYGGVEHRALALHTGVAYRALPLNRTRFGLAYSYGTGDGDPGDNEHRTFDSQYPSNHAYYGYMDLFSLQNMHNIEGTAQTLWRGARLRLAYQAFWIDEPEADAWYNAGAGVVRPAFIADPSSFVGSEVDLTVGRSYGKCTFELGLSHLFRGGYLEDTGSSGEANFAYVMHRVKL